MYSGNKKLNGFLIAGIAVLLASTALAQTPVPATSAQAPAAASLEDPTTALDQLTQLQGAGDTEIASPTTTTAPKITNAQPNVLTPASASNMPAASAVLEQLGAQSDE